MFLKLSRTGRACAYTGSVGLRLMTVAAIKSCGKKRGELCKLMVVRLLAVYASLFTSIGFAWHTRPPPAHRDRGRPRIYSARMSILGEHAHVGPFGLFMLNISARVVKLDTVGTLCDPLFRIIRTPGPHSMTNNVCQFLLLLGKCLLPGPSRCILVLFKVVHNRLRSVPMSRNNAGNSID